MKKHNGKGGSYGMTGMANSMKNSMSTPATINMPQQNTPQPSPTNIPGLNQVRLSGAQVGRPSRSDSESDSEPGSWKRRLLLAVPPVTRLYLQTLTVTWTTKVLG